MMSDRTQTSERATLGDGINIRERATDEDGTSRRKRARMPKRSQDGLSEPAR